MKQQDTVAMPVVVSHRKETPWYTNRYLIAIGSLGIAVSLFGMVGMASSPGTPASAASIDMSDNLAVAHAQLENCQLLANNSTGDELLWAQECIARQQHIIDLLEAPAATPTPSTSATVNPTGTSTPAPTTSAPSTTTPPVTTTTTTSTPPVTTTTTRPPVTTTTTAPTSTWPGTGNTGVPVGITLTNYTGPTNITTNNTVIDGKNITSCIRVQAHGVIIRNSKISCTGTYVLRVQDPYDVLVVDSEIDGRNSDNVCVAFDGFTLTRTNVHGCSDIAKPGNRVLIQDSWFHALTVCGGCHNDTIQMEDGNGVVIRHNRLENSQSQTGVIKLGTALGPLSNVTVENNLLNGGGYTIYAGGINEDTQNLVFRNNRFMRSPQGFYANGGRWGPVSYYDNNAPGNVWTGNVWDNNGQVINP